MYRQNYCGCAAEHGRGRGGPCGAPGGAAEALARTWAAVHCVRRGRRRGGPVKTDDFDYELPSGLIAQHPAEPRDACRLMVVDRTSGQIDHRSFARRARVPRARRRARGERDAGAAGAAPAARRTRPAAPWRCCLLRRALRRHLGVPGQARDGASSPVRTSPSAQASSPAWWSTCSRSRAPGSSSSTRPTGHVPRRRPPHRRGAAPAVHHRAARRSLRSTRPVYAAEEHSVAAPTAGLHFTDRAARRGADGGRAPRHRRARCGPRYVPAGGRGRPGRAPDPQRALPRVRRRRPRRSTTPSAREPRDLRRHHVGARGGERVQRGDGPGGGVRGLDRPLHPARASASAWPTRSSRTSTCRDRRC